MFPPYTPLPPVFHTSIGVTANHPHLHSELPLASNQLQTTFKIDNQPLNMYFQGSLPIDQNHEWPQPTTSSAVAMELTLQNREFVIKSPVGATSQDTGLNQPLSTLVNNLMSQDKINSKTSKKTSPKSGLCLLFDAAMSIEQETFKLNYEEAYAKDTLEYYAMNVTPTRERYTSSESTVRRRTPSSKSDFSGFETDVSSGSRKSRRYSPYTPTGPRPGVGFGRVNLTTRSRAMSESSVQTEESGTTRYESVTTSYISFQDAVHNLIKLEGMHLFPDKDQVKDDVNFLTPVKYPKKFPPKVTWHKTRYSPLDPSARGYELLSAEEVEVCEALRFVPNSYLAIREAMIRGLGPNGKLFKKIDCKKWFVVDGNKIGKLYDWFFGKYDVDKKKV